MTKLAVGTIVNSPAYHLKGLVITEVTEGDILWPYTCRTRDGVEGLYSREELEVPTEFKVGDRVRLEPVTRKFAATTGTEAIVTRASYYSDICKTNHIDVVFIGAPNQCNGSYSPADFELVHVKAKALAPQTKAVLKMLKDSGRITGVQAWNVLKVRSLPRRISDLKEAGYEISRSMKIDHTGQRYAEYRLA